MSSLAWLIFISRICKFDIEWILQEFRTDVSSGADMHQAIFTALLQIITGPRISTCRNHEWSSIISASDILARWEVPAYITILADHTVAEFAKHAAEERIVLEVRPASQVVFKRPAKSSIQEVQLVKRAYNSSA